MTVADHSLHAPQSALPQITEGIGYYWALAWATVLVTVLTAVIWATETIETSVAVQIANVLVPMYMLVFFPIVTFLMIRRDQQTVWTPIVLFLSHTALFKGLGPLAWQFGNDETLAYIKLGIWNRTDAEQLQTNLLNITATAVILLGALFAMSLPYLRQRALPRIRTSVEQDEKAVVYVALAFLIFGACNRYLIVLPFEWGLTNRPPPGIASTLKNMIDLGMALVAYLSVKRGGSWTVLFWIIFPMHILSLTMEFRKSNIILGLLLPAFTAYLGHGKPIRLLGWVVTTVVIYSIYSPFASYGREMIIARGGENVYNASFSDRIEIVGIVIANPALAAAVAAGSDRQDAWIRLDYSGPQSYIMQEYDSGITNPTLIDGLWRLIPRVLWPEKPTTSGPGRWFYQYVTSSDRNARVGATFYADAYWNGGWTYVLVICGIIGVFFGVISSLVMGWLRSANFVMFPAVLLVADFSLMGLNGWVQNGFALVPYLLVYAGLVHGARRILAG